MAGLKKPAAIKLKGNAQGAEANNEAADPAAAVAAAAAETAAAAAAPKPAAVQDHSVPFTGAPTPAAPAAGNQLAPRSYGPSTGTAVAAASGQGGPLAMQPAEADGFDGLDNAIGFGSFPIVKLDKDKFVGIGKDELDEFTCVLMQGREKYVFKADDDHLVYSYDCITGTDGRSLDAHFGEWRDEGVTNEISRSRYFECVAQLVDTARAGELVLLSVAPASVARLAGYRAVLKAKGLKMQDVATKCCKGQKITVGGNKTFYPWEFLFVGEVDRSAD